MSSGANSAVEERAWRIRRRILLAIFLGSLVAMVVLGGSGHELAAGLIAAFWIVVFVLCGLVLIVEGGAGW